MSLKQKIILILVIIVSLITLLIINSWNISRAESDSLRTYATALESYKAKDYSKAHSMFSKVSSHSSLKPAALYRQAKCAEHMQNYKLVNRYYKKLIFKYPDFALSVKVRYLLAQNIYDINPKKSKHHFQNIIKKYPKSEYAVASEYYLGLIQLRALPAIKNQTRLALDIQKAEDYFKTYLKEAPAGRFAISSIDKLIELNKTSLSSEENLLIARSYYTLGDFKSAKKYLNSSNPKTSWCDIVKNSYELKEYDKVRSFTEQGLSEYSQTVNTEDIYKSIDLYLKVIGSQKSAISFLRGFAPNSKGDDYLMYRGCKNLPTYDQPACYSELYAKYPDGQFSADALYNIFYANIKYQRYNAAKQLGKEHLSKFSKTQSSPAVLFWMGKIAEDLKNYEESRTYYKKVISKYPDSYYAYRSYIDMYRIKDSLIAKDLNFKPVVFPYKKSKDGDLVVKLALLKDYSIVGELCKNDKFVQSWLAYQKGDYAQSSVIARDAMEELAVKPDKADFRWRLVYPIHYYELIKETALNNNPVMILSIVKEESHFDPKAKSVVGAKGLMQLMPQTANDVRSAYGLNYSGNDYLFNTKTNLQIGNLYYSQLKKMLNDNDFYVILSYNGGVGAVKGWKQYLNYIDNDDFLEQVPYPETQNYLKKVYRAYWNYARIYE